MSPIALLTITVLITVAAVLLRVVTVRRHRKKLHALARQLNMHYAPVDRLHLAARVAEKFPFPGACDVRLLDLMFRTQDKRHQYVFTIEYGAGVVRGKRRRCRIGGFAEPVARGGSIPQWNLLLAPESMDETQQYEHVLKEVGA